MIPIPPDAVWVDKNGDVWLDWTQVQDVAHLVNRAFICTMWIIQAVNDNVPIPVAIRASCGFLKDALWAFEEDKNGSL